MDINYFAVGIAAVAQFIIGAIWYTPIFGRTWGKIHGVDFTDPAATKVMQKTMVPFLAMQFIATIVTTVVLAIFIADVQSWNAYALAVSLWIGFVVPTQVSAVLFGGTKPEWIATKLLIMVFGSIICLEAAAAILSLMI